MDKGPRIYNNEWIKEVPISRGLLGTNEDKSNCDLTQHLNGHIHSWTGTRYTYLL
jgi:hypothetical protein